MISEFFSWLIDNTLKFLSDAAAFLFSSFYNIFKVIYSGFVSVLSEGWFASVGKDFFGFIYDSSEGVTFNFNIVYFVVGIMLFFFVGKRFIIPFILTILDDLIDWFSPS